ncbi:hypothetical protein CKO40_11120 [Halochromatium glycolicum]|uniref:DUF5132 domain-containing protein n=1 Tax=Halochromatium glycolicum TaxID=85075 RepID=A0AAJ0XA94_9GAMM|nr:hypothetical protein [Halochromatium glycolicum]
MPQLLTKPVVRNTAIGVGVAIAVPVAVAVLAPYLRPAARSLVKAGLMVAERGREVTAELGEAMDDLVAEVREELRDERAANATVAGTGEPAAETAGNRDVDAS